ncbi:hypothetical protein AVEN_27390-1 [Araneus ventricosus]|uniref:Uncharacterized protein n=1 Tax=Araneus ventricosus TaxID=182803 RepID=A0A4Y2NM23_ARAVE|nr:hypothetical protein AVEN_27390-1 [Araneus ventricosus]
MLFARISEPLRVGSRYWLGACPWGYLASHGTPLLTGSEKRGYLRCLNAEWFQTQLGKNRHFSTLTPEMTDPSMESPSGEVSSES